MFSSVPSLWADENSSLLRPPLYSRSQFIFSASRLGVGNDFIDRSSEKFLFSPECATTNTITRLAGVDFDYESVACALSLETSLEGVRTSINMGFLRTGGGVFDPLIESFHESFGFPNGARGRTEEHRYSAEGRMNDGTTFYIEETDFSLLDPQISFSFSVFEKTFGIKGFNLDLSSSLPLNNGTFSLEKPDLKTSLSYQSSRINRYSYLLGASSILHLDREEYGARYDLFSYGIFASFQFQLEDGYAVFVQNVVSSSLENEISKLYPYHWYVDVGLRILMDADYALEFILRENPSPGSGTADVSGFFRLVF